MSSGHDREPQVVSAVDDSRTSAAAAPTWGSRPSVPAGVRVKAEDCTHDTVTVMSVTDLVGECNHCKCLMRLGYTYLAAGRPFYFTLHPLRQEWARG